MMSSLQRIKRLLVVALTIVSFVFIVFLICKQLETCESVIWQNEMCRLYDRQIITGSLCRQLCDTHTLNVVSCRSSLLVSRRVYYTDDYTLRLAERPGDPLQPGRYSAESRFAVPEAGTSMAQFRALLKEYIAEKLGGGEQRDVYRRIIASADVNSDGKLSLAEAKTLWALLQINEYFVLLMLPGSSHVPRLVGFCGDVYAHVTVPHQSLYRADDGLWSKLEFWPQWRQRAKIAVGLLEFADEIYQDSVAGTFYTCSTNGFNVGYSKHYDAQVLDLSHVFSNSSLFNLVRQRSCETDNDCYVTKQCVTECQAQMCSATLSRPSVTVICGMLTKYIMTGAPSALGAEIEKLLIRCKSLNSNMSNLQLEHSLIINDLKTLLWKQISV